MTTSTAAPTRARGKPGARRATARPRSAARKSRDAALRREIARIVRPMVARMVAGLIEDRFDLDAIAAARASGEAPVPVEDVLRRVGL